MAGNGADLPAPLVEPPPELRYRRKVRVRGALLELWRARELVRTLVERDLRARYRQAVLGVAWSLIPPVGLMVVFSLFVTRIGDVFTEGVPYQLYAYVALVPWQFTSASLLTGGQSLISNLPLLNKVYCPREVFPLANIAVAGFDALVATLVLLVLFPVNDTWPNAMSFLVLPLLVVQLAFTVGVTLLLAAITIYIRDVRHALPIALQLGLFATPVAYSLDAVPDHLVRLYSFLNPLAPLIDGYRSCVLLGEQPQWDLVGLAALSSAGLLALGFAVFKRLETGIADVG
jgi:ABC-2 type transport system permease protein/lipopolysaccharide transport system permease protein